MKEENLVQARKKNLKIYGIYRMISMDLLFYYGISFLFLTQTKGISASDVVLSDVFYAIFMIVLQIPATILIEKLGTRKCTILANIFNFLCVVMTLFCSNLVHIIIANLFSALCFSIKDVSDTALLTYSIPKYKKRGESFSKIEAKASKNYYYLNAGTSLVVGSLFLVNPYIPVIVCLLITIASTIISLGFQEIKEEKKVQGKEISAIQKVIYSIKDLKEGFTFILKSQRLRSLILYSGITWGIFSLLSTYRSSILVDMKASATTISIIYAIIYISSAFATKKQLQFHNCFRNHSLGVILASTIGAMILSGIIGLSGVTSNFAIFIIAIAYIVIYGMKGIYGVISQRYLSNFASDEMLPKIYSANAISRNIFRTGIGLIGSYLLDITNTANAMILLGLMAIFIAIGLLSYMKTRIGLKPEEYSKEEINTKEKETILK